MSPKIGFWSVFALVTGSQIGSGVFMLPASLAPYGLFSLAGWLISGVGAIALALVFAGLCSRFPQTGGPHVYVQHAFGPAWGFFTGWTYWVISWVSTTVVVVVSISYLTPLIGHHAPGVYLALEIGLVVLITALNLKGVQAAGHAEFVLTILKFLPLLMIPLIALCGFDRHHFVMAPCASALPLSQILSQVTLLTLWGFIGLESATTPAGSVENPGKTIPRAIVIGTLCVAALYLINSVGIMGLIPGSQLVHSKAPYVDTVQIIFGGQWHLLIAVIASVACIGTLNAWMLASGQIALGLAEDHLMPSLFAKKNKYDAPFFALLTSCAGILPLLILTNNSSLSQQITAIIDFSVVAFLFVYLICVVAFLKVLKTQSASWLSWLYGILALIFCGWILYETPLKTLTIASLFTLSGLPVYGLWYRR